MKDTAEAMPAKPAETGAVPFGAAVLSVFRHEWRDLVHSPLTPVFQAGFLLALSVATFLIGDFLASDLATLDSLWTFLPWVALVFVPALAMRAFADEPGNRSLEFMLTLPLPLSAVVAGKWLAGFAVLAVTLALTLPFAATVAYLGEPDWGVAVSGYVAAALLLGAFLAIAMLAAALARDQVVSYLLGLSLLFVMLALGWDVVPRLLGTAAGAALVELASHLSPKYWFDSMVTGRIELGALAYFAVAIGLALAGAAALIEARRGPLPDSPAAWPRRALPAAIAVVCVAAALASARFPLAADMTAEREFTLHSETLAIGRSLPAPVTVDLYWSDSQPSIPASIRAHARRTRDLVASIAARSGGKVVLRETDPKPDTDEEERAIAAGVRRVPMSSGDSLMFGATFSDGERHGLIDYFDVRRAELLEYDVALALNSLARKRTAKVALLTPLLTPSNVKEPRAGLAFLEELKQGYDVAIVPHFADALPDDIDVLVVADASVLKRSMLYSIDQHVMAGKGLIVMMDPYVRFNAGSRLAAPVPSAEIDDISDILLAYGVKYLGEAVVGDRKLAAPVLGSDQRQISYPFWLRTPDTSLARDHPVSASLKELLFAEPGELALSSSRARALITTSAETGALPKQVFDDKAPDAMTAEFKTDGKTRVLAAVIDGPFASAFTAPPGDAPKEKFRPRSEKPSAVFAIADVDWIFDPLSLQEVSSDGRTFSRPLNDNHALLLNMVEYGSGDARMIGIRSRGRIQRPFTRIAELLAASQQRYREQEARILERIAAVEDNIKKVLQISRVLRVEELPAEVEARIVKLRQDMLPFRRELRATRAAMREDVERLERRLTMANLLAGPLLVLLLAAGLHALRRRSG